MQEAASIPVTVEVTREFIKTPRHPFLVAMTVTIAVSSKNSFEEPKQKCKEEEIQQIAHSSLETTDGTAVAVYRMGVKRKGIQQVRKRQQQTFYA